jgi:hypothetical protein
LYYSDIYRNLDPHFAEDNPAMVSFPTTTEVGSIIFLGLPGSGKLTILGQLNDKFKVPPGSSHTEPDIHGAEIRNVIFRVPLVNCPSTLLPSPPASLFEGARTIIVIVDSTSDLPTDLLQIASVASSAPGGPPVRVFLNKTDLLEQAQAESVLVSLTEQVTSQLPNVRIVRTSIVDGSALREVSICIEGLLPKCAELREVMNRFATSLELQRCVLVDLQSRVVLLGSGEDPIDQEMFAIAQDGVEMFVGIAAMMDAKNSQSIASAELQNGTFLHFFWSAFDVLLVGIASHRIPTATAKNNVSALLQAIKRALE